MKKVFVLFLVFIFSCTTNIQNDDSSNVINENNSSNEITQEGWDSENETWEEYKLRRKESVEATTTTLSSFSNKQLMSCVEFYDEIVNLFDRIIIVVKREKSSTIRFENYEIDTQEVIDNNSEFYDEWLEIKKDLANIDFRLYENSKIIGMDSNFEVYSNINEYIRLMMLQNRSNMNLFSEVAYPKESTIMDSSGNPIDMIDYYFEESIGFGNEALVYLDKIEKFSCEN
jgi:hypothetical protein